MKLQLLSSDAVLDVCALSVDGLAFAFVAHGVGREDEAWLVAVHRAAAQNRCSRQQSHRRQAQPLFAPDDSYMGVPLLFVWST
jgi:hypothetical protein